MNSLVMIRGGLAHLLVRGGRVLVCQQAPRLPQPLKPARGFGVDHPDPRQRVEIDAGVGVRPRVRILASTRPRAASSAMQL
jgi:hypothetical protein